MTREEAKAFVDGMSTEQRLAMMRGPAFRGYVATRAKEAHVTHKINAIGTMLLGGLFAFFG